MLVIPISTLLGNFISKTVSHDIYWKIQSLFGMYSKQWGSSVFKDAEEAGNWGDQIKSKQSFFSYTHSDGSSNLWSLCNNSLMCDGSITY